jgi:hypothetical protein
VAAFEREGELAQAAMVRVLEDVAEVAADVVVGNMHVLPWLLIIDKMHVLVWLLAVGEGM